MAQAGLTETPPRPRTNKFRRSARAIPWWVIIIASGLLVWSAGVLRNPQQVANYREAFIFIWPGIWLTLQVTALSYLLALVLGLVIGLMRLSGNPLLYHPATVYVEVMRGLPMLVIILYAGFVIGPALRNGTGIDPPMLYRAVAGLGIGYGAYLSEVFRSGIQTVGRGQREAALSLGMNYRQTMRHVVLPQAVRIVLPPLGNNLIALLKDSALISVLALEDILQLGRQFITRTFRTFEGYNTVALIYLGLTMVLSLVVRAVEQRTRIDS